MSERMARLPKLCQSLAWYHTTPEEQYSDRALETYDLSAKILTGRLEFAKFLVSTLGEKPGKVLEIAAGSGLVSLVLQEESKDVTFLDLSPQALTILKERTSSDKIVNASFLDLPFPDGLFNTIVCVGGYRYVPTEKKRLFWEETARVLSPNGKLFLAQFKPKGFPINGTTLGENVSQYGLQQQEALQHNSKINLGPLAVQTGKYEVIQYGKSE